MCFYLRCFIYPAIGFLLLLSSCQLIQPKESHRQSKHLKIAHRLRARAIKRIQRKYNVRLAAVGGGMNGSVNHITLWFNCYELLSKDELRSMVVNGVEILLEEVNQSEEIRPYLIHYPFESRDVDITIYVRDENDRHPFHPQIAVAAGIHGMIEYRTYSPEKEFGYFEEVEEPYEEARAIVFGLGVRPQKILAVLSDCGGHLDRFSPHPGASTLGSSRSSRSVPPRYGDHLPYLSEDVRLGSDTRK